MPADRLTAYAAPAAETAIWKYLAGADLYATAEEHDLRPAELSAAADTYRNAGHHALAAWRKTRWQQLYLRFPDWNDAEHAAATHLLPLLAQAEQRKTAISWWFMRKHPCWRLRLLPASPETDALAELSGALDQLVEADYLEAWWPVVYEAETAAFGGPPGIDTAHRLFAADSRGVLDLAASAEAGLGRRELSILLCGALMRDGARLEWYERGDVWDRVAAERPLPADVPPDKIAAMAATLRTLLLADTAPGGQMFGIDGPAAAREPWATAFRDAGRDLADAARTGQSTRGLRDVLSYHVIFHWNRLGLPARAQSILAHAARHAILGPATTPEPPTPVRSLTAASATPHPYASLSYFPLIHQGRQHCGDLSSRIALVEEHARNSTDHRDADRQINDAAAAWNLAALIAADCGLTDLAEQMCIAQFDVFHQMWPLSGRPAVAALQPLVNLARLRQRAGDPEDAYRILGQTETAVRNGGVVNVAGITIVFDRFLDTDGDPAPVQTWLRRTMREDGTRALVAARLWNEAAEHASRHDDFPDRMNESRQLRVIAAALDGRHDQALALIDEATAVHAWHRAAAHLLRAFASPAAHDTSELISSVQRAREAASDPVLTMFRIRLGLTAAHLVRPTYTRHAEHLRAEAARDAEQSGSAYAARVVLNDATDNALTMPANSHALQTLVASAGLCDTPVPAEFQARLVAAAEFAANALKGSLSRR